MGGDHLCEYWLARQCRRRRRRRRSMLCWLLLRLDLLPRTCSRCRLIFGLPGLARLLFLWFAIIDRLAIRTHFFLFSLPLRFRRSCSTIRCRCGGLASSVCSGAVKRRSMCGSCRSCSTYYTSTNFRIGVMRARNIDRVCCEADILRRDGRRRDGR